MKSSATYLTKVINKDGFPASDESKWLYGTFPDMFVWGVASAAYSVRNLFLEKKDANDLM